MILLLKKDIFNSCSPLNCDLNYTPRSRSCVVLFLFTETKLIIVHQSNKKKSAIFIDLTKKVKDLKNKMYAEGLTEFEVKKMKNQGNVLWNDYILQTQGIKSHDQLDYKTYTGRPMVTVCVETIYNRLIIILPA